MNEISAIPARIVSWLSTQLPLRNLIFMTEYPSRKKQIPLKTAVVAVGIERIRLEDKYVEISEGVLEKQGDCRSANIRIRLGIHVPYKEGGGRCHDVFCSIMECLTFGSDFYILCSGCESVKADRDTDAFVLQGFADVAADFRPEEA